MKILRHLALVMAALVFAIGILGASVWRTSAQVIVEEDLAGPPSFRPPLGSVLGQATESAEVNYFLAYPGILPDNFLYPLKMLRDRVWLFLTTDSLKKAKLNLLFADKRLGAAKALIEGNKGDLGMTTLSKAEKYLEKAIDQERVANKAEKDTAAFLEKLSLATQKHEEVILKFEDKITNEQRSVFQNALEYTRRGHTRVREVR